MFAFISRILSLSLCAVALRPGLAWPCIRSWVVWQAELKLKSDLMQNQAKMGSISSSRVSSSHFFCKKPTLNVKLPHLRFEPLDGSLPGGSAERGGGLGRGQEGRRWIARGGGGGRVWRPVLEATSDVLAQSRGRDLPHHGPQPERAAGVGHFESNFIRETILDTSPPLRGRPGTEETKIPTA